VSSAKYSVSKIVVLLICMYILFFSLWPFFIDIRLTEKVGINPERIILALLVFASLLLYFYGGINREKTSIIRNNKVAIYSITVFFFWRFLAVVLAGGMESFPYWIYEVISNYVLFIMALIFVDSHNARGKILGWLTFSVFVVLLISVIEFFNGKFLFTALVTGESRAALGAISGSFRNNLYRVQGTFEHALVLSQYLLILFPMVLLYINRYLRATALSRLVFSSTMIILTVIVLLMAQCRTSLVTIFAWVVYSVYRKVKNSWQRQVTLIFVIVFAVLLYDLYIAGSNFISSDARYAQLVNGFYAVLNSPLVGYGPGVVMGEILYSVGLKESGAISIYEVNSTTVDSRYLSIVLESGILSLFLFVIFLAKVFSSVSGNIVSGERVVFFYYSLSLLAGIVTMLTLSIYTVMPMFFLIAAMSLVCKSESDGSGSCFDAS